MEQLKNILAVLFLAASVAAIPPDNFLSASLSSTQCDFSGMDLEGAVDKFLAKFPKNVTVFEGQYNTVFPGFEVGHLSATGLNKLRRNGPAFPYCVNGTRFLKTDIVNAGDLVFYSPWRMCAGREGHIKFMADFSIFTVLFRVSTGGPDGGIVLQYEEPALPLKNYNIYMILEDAGETLRIASGVLSKLLPSYLEELWTLHFFSYITDALRNTQ